MQRISRTYRAGESLEDFCRACKTDRSHTVVVTDQQGAPLRVACGYCHSEHNYRGGPRVGVASGPPRAAPRASHDRGASAGSDQEAFPIVSDRERIAAPMPQDTPDLELLLRRIIREETELTPVAPAAKWRNGSLVLKPGTAGLQERSWPIETFFHKIVMLRNRLRTLEQVVNASALTDEEKVRVQGYISGCYGTLTSFNILFADQGDQFKGQGEDQ